jgi:hypothetical protein
MEEIGNLAPYAVIRVAADPGSVTEAMPPTTLDVPVQPSPVPPPLAVQLFALVDAQVRVVDRRT